MNSEYLKVEPALKELVGPKHLQLHELTEASLPLFLLADLDPDLVAFAGVNGKPEEAYRRALDIFKSLYADAGDSWAERDLTLVICIQERDRQLSAYWNQIELDKYFCRKFVIHASEDLSEQLKRLPFVPLNPQRVAGLARPLSAQTLLRKKHGVETWLAEGLAVPGGRSPESIVKKSLTASSVPIFKNLEIESFVGSPIAIQPGVRIKDIRIENFRAYCDQQFDFRADVIVLYGPNGLGKTSLFDAMDFLCTGGVARFDDRYSKNEQQRLSSLTRLGAEQSEARVSATVSVNGQEFKVERQVSNAKSATVNGSSSNRTETLIRLANLPKSTKMDLRVENFVRLFRATHLFGQDSASLTYDIHSKSTLSEDTVARMLAFQDYVEAIGKSEKVSAEIAAMIEIENSRRSTAADASSAKQVELDNLSTVALDLETPEMIASKGDDLAKETSALTNMVESESDVEITSSVVQGWRGLLEGQLSHVREQLTIAKEAEVRFPSLQELRALVSNLTEQRESAKQEQAKAHDLIHDWQKGLSDLETKRNALVEQERGLTVQVDSISWLNTNVSEYQRLSQEIKSVDNEVQVARVESARLAGNCEKISAEATLLESSARQIQQQIRVDEKELSSVNDLLATITEWRMGLKRSDELSEEITKAANMSRDIENEISGVAVQLQQASAVATGALNILNTAQQSQTELQTLLDNLTQYVTSEVCPLCGHWHESKSALLEEINRQRGAHNELVNKALREVESTKFQEQGLEARLEKLRQSQILGTADLNSLMEERDRISARLEQYTDSGLALGIFETNPDRCQETANARAGVLAGTLTHNRGQLAVHSKLLTDKQVALALETQLQNHAVQLVTDLEGRQRVTRNLMSQLQKRAANLYLDFELARETHEQFDRLSEELRKTKVDLDAIKHPSQKLETEINTLKYEIDQREKQIREVETRLSTARQSFADIEQVFARLGFSVDAKAEEIGSFRMRLEEQELALANLRSRVIDFEIALDAAQTQAALVKMQDELTVLRKNEAESNERVEALSSWRAYFDEINNSLSNVQQTVLHDYVDKYGPLASKIQQRLRPVYGFGELKLHAEDGGIEVTVERNGSEYLPSDYFSESQLQIVMLSLFLSAVLTQTWSSFGLILLDDPVTHFDDLNAYALLDVIRGLVDTGGIRHQFVVSTCEERLYRLMRQRFGKIKTDVAFYEFQSIGDNGPVVVRR